MNGQNPLGYFGNLGQFNYGSLGGADSPALIGMTPPGLYPGMGPTPGSPPGYLDLLKYISGLVGGSGSSDPGTGLGGIQGFLPDDPRIQDVAGLRVGYGQVLR